MKIAIFHELHEGGALRAASALALELSKDHEVKIFKLDFVSRNSNGILGRIRHDFFDLIHLGFLHWDLARKIDQQKFDMVLVHPSRYTQAPLLLCFCRTPTVYYAQEPLRLVYDPAYINELKSLSGVHWLYELLNRKWRQWIDMTAIKSAEKILCNSKFSQRNIFLAYGLEAQVSYLGVDTHLFHPQPLLKKYDVLFLGAPVDIEGYHLLMEAKLFSRHAWRMKVIARGSEGKGVSDTKLVTQINQSQIVVCLARREPFGLVPLEAGACRVPVIAVDEGGYRESIRHQRTGLLVSRNARALASAIDLLLDHPEYAASLAQSAYQIIKKHWTWFAAGRRLVKSLSVNTSTI